MWSLSVKHVIVHQSVSVGCRPLTRQRGHARSQAQRLYQCPQNVLCMTDDICAGVDVGEKTWCYFQVQWHSLGRHKVSVVLKSSVPTLCEFWHLGQQRSSSTSSLAVSHTRAQVGTNQKGQGVFCRPRYVLSRPRGFAPGDLQVGMSSRKALSVSDLKRRGEKERERQQAEWLFSE